MIQFLPHQQKSSYNTLQLKEQLNSLLQTNTILVQNKRLIYQSKINTYIKQIEKIEKMILTKKIMREKKNLKMDEDDDEDDSYEDDLDQQAGLLNKMKHIQQKKLQAIDKLSMIDRIEQDIKSMQLIKNPENQFINNHSQLIEQTNITSSNSNKNKYQSSLNKQNLFTTTEVDSKDKIDHSQFFSNVLNTQQQYWKQSEDGEFVNNKKQNIDMLRNSKICLSVNTSIYRKLERSEQKQIGGSSHKKKTTQAIKEKRPTHHNKKITKPMDKYLSIDRDGQSNQSMLLWSDRQTPVDKTCKNTKQKLIKIDDLLKNTHSLTSTPISIKNSEFKQCKNTEQKMQKTQKNSQNQNLTKQNQYKFILEELQQIVQLANKKNKCQKIVIIPNHHFSINDNIQQSNQILVKIINQYLKKIKQYMNLSFNVKTEQNIQKQQNIQKLTNEQIYLKCQLKKIQQQYEMYCKDIEQRSIKYETLLKEIDSLEKSKKQIENKMKITINSHQDNLKNFLNQLEELYHGFISNMTQRERNNIKEGKDFSKILNTQRLTTNKKQLKQLKRPTNNKKQKNHQHINNHIIQIYEFIRMITQSQKLTILQNKQTILSHQYNINILNGQEKDLQNNVHQLKEKMQKISNEVEEKTKQLSKIWKQKQKISKQLQQNSAQSQQYQNLSVIRRNSYNDLQSKYTTLKSKKTKLQTSLKSHQKQLSQKQQILQKLEKNIQKQNNHLSTINQDIIHKLKDKQQLVKEIQKIDQQLNKKNQIIKNVQNSINKKQQNNQKLQKILEEIQRNIDNYQNTQINKKKDIDKLQQLIKQTTQTYKHKQQTLSSINSKLSETQHHISKKKDQLHQLQSHLTQKHLQLKTLQQQTQSISQKSKLFTEEVRKLQIAKNDLQQALVQIIDKKQQSMKMLSCKYEELEMFQEETQQLKNQIQKLISQKNDKTNENNQLEENIINLQQELKKMGDLIESAQTKLTNLLSQLQLNRDQQQNLLQRISKLRALQTTLILQIAVKTYTQPDQQPQSKDPQLYTFLPLSLKQQIESLIKEINEALSLKQKLYKEKQQNRKLKLDNQRLLKFCQMDTYHQQYIRT